MKLDPFITFQNQGEYYILQSKHPNYIGKILRFESDKEMEFYNNSDSIYSTTVPGYRIGITFSGALQGNQLLFHPQWRDELRAIFENMAQFYLKDRILVNENKWRKYYI